MFRRYTIKGTNIIIEVGDCVLIRRSNSSVLPSVAKVIDFDDIGENAKVIVRWYYRPEESIGGRRKFHGSKELILSNHFDIQRADTIEAKCNVHNFKSYITLGAVGNEDFFCRFNYNYSTGLFNPDKVTVYCKCEMPKNPDEVMLRCEGCKDWFHPVCIDMTLEEAKGIEHFFCGTCSSKEQIKSQTCSSEEQVKLSHVTSGLRDSKGINSNGRLFGDDRDVRVGDHAVCHVPRLEKNINSHKRKRIEGTSAGILIREAADDTLSSKLQRLQELESELLVKIAKLDEAKELLKSLEMQVIEVKKEIDEVRADLSLH